MKKTTALIALFMVMAFALDAVFSTSSSSTNTFHMFQTPDTYFINTRVSFTNNFAVASSSGGLICPGTSLTSTPSSGTGALWAADGVFSAVSQYPQSVNAGAGDVAQPPIDYSTLNSNAGVTWISSSQFNTVVNTAGTYRTAPDAILNSFTSQPVSYEQNGVGPIDFANKLAGVGIYCKGNLRTILVSPAGVETEIANQQMPSISPSQLTLSSPGTWTVRSELRDVQCLGALKKMPEQGGDPAYFRIYVFRRDMLAPPLLLATNTVNVVNTQAGTTLGGVICPGSSCISPPGPLQIAPDERKYMVITANNNGNVPISFNGLGATNGFMIEPLSPALCTLLGISCPAGIGFNSPVAPGASIQLHVVVTAPNPLPASTRLSFQAVANGATCSTVQPQTIDLNLDFTINPNSYSCSFTVPTSSVASVPQNTPFDFNIACAFAGNPVPCSSTSWSLSGVSGGVTAHTADSATILVSSPAGAGGTSGALSATNGSYSCSMPINTATATDAYQCTISPESVTLAQNTMQTFNLACTFNGIPVPCSRTLWAINGLSATEPNPPTVSSVTLLFQSGNGVVSATNSSYSCSASVLVDDGTGNPPCPGGNCNNPCPSGNCGGGTGPRSDNCQLGPSVSFIFPAQSQTLTLKCADTNGAFNQACPSSVQFGPITGPFTRIPISTAGSFDYISIKASNSPSDLGATGRVCASGPISGGKTAICCAVMAISGAQCGLYV